MAKSETRTHWLATNSAGGEPSRWQLLAGLDSPGTGCSPGQPDPALAESSVSVLHLRQSQAQSCRILVLSALISTGGNRTWWLRGSPMDRHRPQVYC